MDPNTSVGRPLGEFDTKRRFGLGTKSARLVLKCWQAGGPDRLVFGQHLAPEIRLYLEQTDDGLQSSGEVLLISLFMVGVSPERAKPTVTIVSEDKRARKRAFSLLQKSGIMAGYPNFALAHSSRAAEMRRMEQLAESGAGGGGDSVKVEPEQQEVAEEHGDFLSHIYAAVSDGESLVGKKMQIRQGDEEFGNATAGLYLRHKGHHFLLTVGHFLLPAPQALGDSGKRPTYDDSNSEDDDDDDDDECEISGFDDQDLIGYNFAFSEDDDSGQVDVTSRGSLSPSLSSVEFFSDLSSDAYGSGTLTDPTIRPESRNDSLQGWQSDWNDDGQLEPHLTASKERAADLVKIGQVAVTYPPLDYCLIELDEEFWPNNSNDPDLLDLDDFEDAIKDDVEDPPVFTRISSAGLVSGSLSGSLNCMRFPHFPDLWEAYTVSLNRPLQPGDCGSIVRDARTGKILGPIVVGSQLSGLAVVLPARLIFESILRQLDLLAFSNVDVVSASAHEEQAAKRTGTRETAQDQYRQAPTGLVNVGHLEIGAFSWTVNKLTGYLATCLESKPKSAEIVHAINVIRRSAHLILECRDHYRACATLKRETAGHGRLFVRLVNRCRADLEDVQNMLPHQPPSNDKELEQVRLMLQSQRVKDVLTLVRSRSSTLKTLSYHQQLTHSLRASVGLELGQDILTELTSIILGTDIPESQPRVGPPREADDPHELQLLPQTNELEVQNQRSGSGKKVQEANLLRYLSRVFVNLRNAEAGYTLLHGAFVSAMSFPFSLPFLRSLGILLCRYYADLDMPDKVREISEQGQTLHRIPFKALAWCQAQAFDTEADSFRFDGCNNRTDSQANTGMSPLHLATQMGEEEILSEMLGYNSDGSTEVQETFRRVTPLLIACSRNDEAIVKLLLEHGAKVDARDEYMHDGTALHLCQHPHGGTGVARMLLENGIDVNATNKLGQTALHLAATVGNGPMVDLLLEAGAKPDVMDLEGTTPLMVAVVSRVMDRSTKCAVLKALLEKGADPRRQRTSGESAFDMAEGHVKDFLKMGDAIMKRTVARMRIAASSGEREASR